MAQGRRSCTSNVEKVFVFVLIFGFCSFGLSFCSLMLCVCDC